jgi:hypothetical protein
MIVPREHETAVNKAPVVRALAALLMVFAILSTIARVVTRLLTIRRLRVDDVLIMAATVRVSLYLEHLLIEKHAK